MWDPVNINCTWHWIERRSWKKEEKKIYIFIIDKIEVPPVIDMSTVGGRGGQKRLENQWKPWSPQHFNFNKKRKKKPQIYTVLFSHIFSSLNQSNLVRQPVTAPPQYHPAIHRCQLIRRKVTVEERQPDFNRATAALSDQRFTSRGRRRGGTGGGAAEETPTPAVPSPDHRPSAAPFVPLVIASTVNSS